MSNLNVQKKVVSIDTKTEMVIDWDKTGASLSFDIEKGRFLTLKPEVVEKLSSDNQIRYRMAQEYAVQVDGDDADDEIARLFSTTPSYAGASARMQVLNPDPKMEYAFTGVDGLENMRGLGYEVVQNSVKTGQNPQGKGVTKFMSNGKVDLVMMQISKEKHEKLMAKNHDGIQNFMDGQTAAATRSIDGTTAGSTMVDDYNPMT